MSAAFTPSLAAGDGEAAFYIGRAHFRRGRYEDAARVLEQAVKQKATSSRLAWLGRAYGQQALMTCSPIT